MDEDSSSDEEDPKKTCYPLFVDISSDEEDLPQKTCPLFVDISSDEEDEEDLPADDEEEIVYLGTYKTIKIPTEDPEVVYLGKTTRAPPNSPSVSAATNIWLEGNPVYPVQVIFDHF